jgi:NAD(P)-dependent dehydrogenase (short-subunit alcohol dehydrogenase family)
VVTGPPRSRLSVDGAVVVITGAPSGLGAHLVDVFASEGAKGPRRTGCAWPGRARAAFGPIDVLVNNAGAIGAVGRPSGVTAPWRTGAAGGR